MANDDKKIGAVKGADKAKGVAPTQTVDEVVQVKKTDSVKGASSVAGTRGRQPTRAMSMAEREELFRLVDEEAKKMFDNSGFSEQHKKVVQDAVRMVVDAATIDEDE